MKEQKYEDIRISRVDELQPGDRVCNRIIIFPARIAGQDAKRSSAAGTYNESDLQLKLNNGARVERPLPNKEVQEVEIDPGEGFRLLAEGEKITAPDEWDYFGKWTLAEDTVGDVVDGGCYRRQIRLQDKEHRWLDVGETVLDSDEIKGEMWEPCGIDGVCAKPEFYRRALSPQEKGVSKSCEPGPDSLERLKAWLETPESEAALREALKLSQATLDAYRNSIPQHLIPCNPPSTPERSVPHSGDDIDALKRLARNLGIRNYQPSEPASSTPLEDSEEEYEELNDLGPRDILTGDILCGQLEALEDGSTLPAGTVLLAITIQGKRLEVLATENQLVALLSEPVRRRKSKPDPKAPLVWEGEAVVDCNQTGWSLLPTSRPPFEDGQRVKVTVEAI